MNYLLNILDSISESSTFFLVLIILLIIVSLSMLYLLYTQKKEIAEKNIENQMTSQRQIIEQVEEINDTQNEVVQENNELQYDLPIENSAVQTPELVEITDDEIPKELEYTQALWENDNFDLKSVTQELEALPREKTIQLTPYEAEQEEKAIISYDELISQTDRIDINYNKPKKLENDVYVKQNDLNKSNQFGEKKVNKVDVTTYEHEEAFLEALKQLQKILN